MTREKEILFRGITTLAGLRNILLHRRIAKRGGEGECNYWFFRNKNKKGRKDTWGFVLCRKTEKKTE